uniref:Uncharacterized protein n=1 Tax=Glossina austeni TaxID=7395 RepID=A0A1A9VIA9_GLOAU
MFGLPPSLISREDATVTVKIYFSQTISLLTTYSSIASLSNIYAYESMHRYQDIHLESVANRDEDLISGHTRLN